MKNSLLIVCCAFIIGCNDNKGHENHNSQTDTMQTHTTHQHADNAMISSMQSSMDRMMSVKPTENMDVDFAAMMIPHHQAAIDMSREALKSAKDTFVIRMANAIIDDQQREISMMNEFLQKTDTTSLTKNAPANQMHHMNKMMQAMHAVKPTGDIDQDFVRMMIPHHQGAIDMAQMEIANGKNPQMKKLAEDIVRNQKSEINDFNNWLNK